VQEPTRIDVGGSSFFALAGFRDARFSTPFALATHLGELSVLLQDRNLRTNTESALTSASFDQGRVDQLVSDLQRLGFGLLECGQRPRRGERDAGRIGRCGSELGLLGVPRLDAYAAMLAVDKPGHAPKCAWHRPVICADLHSR
jgi:hypothetical protein